MLEPFRRCQGTCSSIQKSAPAVLDQRHPDYRFLPSDLYNGIVGLPQAIPGKYDKPGKRSWLLESQIDGIVRQEKDRRERKRKGGRAHGLSDDDEEPTANDTLTSRGNAIPLPPFIQYYAEIDEICPPSAPGFRFYGKLHPIIMKIAKCFPSVSVAALKYDVGQIIDEATRAPLAVPRGFIQFRTDGVWPDQFYLKFDASCISNDDIARLIPMPSELPNNSAIPLRRNATISDITQMEVGAHFQQYLEYAWVTYNKLASEWQLERVKAFFLDYASREWHWRVWVDGALNHNLKISYTLAELTADRPPSRLQPHSFRGILIIHYKLSPLDWYYVRSSGLDLSYRSYQSWSLYPFEHFVLWEEANTNRSLRRHCSTIRCEGHPELDSPYQQCLSTPALSSQQVNAWVYKRAPSADLRLRAAIDAQKQRRAGLEPAERARINRFLFRTHSNSDDGLMSFIQTDSDC